MHPHSEQHVPAVGSVLSGSDPASADMRLLANSRVLDEFTAGVGTGRSHGDCRSRTGEMPGEATTLVVLPARIHDVVVRLAEQHDDRRLHRSARRRPAPPHGDPFARRMPSSSPQAAAGSTCAARLPRRPGPPWVRGDAARCLADSGTMESDGLPPLTSLDRREQRSAGHTGAGAPRYRMSGRWGARGSDAHIHEGEP